MYIYIVYRDTHPVDLGLRGRQRQARFSAIRIKSQQSQPCTSVKVCVVFVSWATFTLQPSVSTGIFSPLLCDSDLNNQCNQQSHFFFQLWSGSQGFVLNLMLHMCVCLQGQSVNPT